ncbi:glycosyltransferase family 2 protein [Cellulomonas oligotrophica]|uniref:Cellulose synthase/poly-beta-1,6-N-acetylglucosamine synthase-like glycosyltransferase n=1 Tax=Cellulomonas oligotrophica TaxID=931536 RepID=A0A7Y9FH04_9CELL|nr:glycosyltransferase family 2 protein [Cellulomonas oligotrophica]NYD86752.1 cellulose synthase/poly-beta-1,6-N-acetylglucosamine synthase-like glycosyltransferase [Cellulomonas oligotrophica]GIG32462.1 glycosyl transferase family 2 [Cellulomonas oligotrophica]
MTDVASAVATTLVLVVTVYYAVHNLLLVLLVARAGAAVVEEAQWPHDLTHSMTFANPLTPGVSVLVPAHDEEAGIVASVESLLALRYPRLEVVVVDDGSADRTAELLLDGFAMEPAELPVTSHVAQEGETLGTFRSTRHPHLVLVRKRSVGRRSDAVNAGFRRSTQPLVCMIDADSVLEPDALLHVVQPFVDDHEVVAAGGLVLPSNGAVVERGRVTSLRAPRTWLERTQVLEYLRAFLVGRSGWASANGLMIISGAFGVFRREVVEEIGGLDPDSLAEDADLVVATHHALRGRGTPYRVVFVPEPVCWTEVPTSLAVLRRQRHRWSQGLGELLGKHRGMLGRPRYGVLGVVTMPYFLLFELLGPVLEVVGLVVAVLGLALGWVPPAAVAAFFVASVLLSVAVSLAALLVEESVFRRYPSWRDTLVLAVSAAMEPFWYRPMHSWWRAVGLWRALRRRPATWGVMTRQGFPHP